MKKTLLAGVTAAALACGVSLAAQSVRDISFDAADLLKTPLDLYVGEVNGVGQNSKGQILRLHADGSSLRDPGRQPDIFARRLTAAAVRSDWEVRA